MLLFANLPSGARLVGHAEWGQAGSSHEKNNVDGED